MKNDWPNGRRAQGSQRAQAERAWAACPIPSLGSDTFLHPANGLYVITADGTGPTLVIGGSDFKGQPEWWQ